MKEHKSSMIDNRKVSGNHQEGISRVLQKGKVEKTWADGKMSMRGDGKESNWKQSGESLTPRKA